MLNENIKTVRKSKGISQEELSVKINVVRQTISKWEQGLSVPDADMLILLSQALETPVSVLLGENVDESKENDLKVISNKLEIINLQLTQRKDEKRKIIHIVFILLCVLVVLIYVLLIAIKSPYFGWNYEDPETAVFGLIFHVFEWLYVRFAPFLFVGTIIGVFSSRKKV